MKTPNDPRHLARKVAFSVIYAVESTNSYNYNDNIEELLGTVLDSQDISEFDRKLFDSIISTVKERKEEINNLIAKHSPDWNLDKMYKTDISLLILATAEIFKKEAPIKVIIDEAVELAKEFGQVDSPKFVNGVLAGIVKEISDDK